MRITTQNLTNIKPQLADFLSNIEVGDSVRGRIIELLGESISLKTASGQMFTAALMTDAELKPGQNIELVISSITEEGMFAELKSETTKSGTVTEDAKLQQVLKQMDIKPDVSNLQAAKLLVKFSMPITKENVLLLASTQKSIDMMAQGDMINTLALIQSEQDISNTEYTKLLKQAVLMENQGAQAFKLLSEAFKNNNAELQKNTAANELTNEPTDKVKVITEAGYKQSEKKADVEQAAKPVMQQLIEALDTEEMQRSAPKVEKLIDKITMVIETAARAKPEHSAYLISKDMEVTPDTVKTLLDNLGSQGKLGTKLQELERLTEVLEQNKLEVSELKQDIKKLFLKPESLKETDQLQETIKDIVKISSKLEGLIKEHGLEDRVDRSALSDIKSNLDFMKNINSNINYIQVPILINESKTTADMYVFSGKKRGKSINPDSASILIALDLSSLGHIESLINISKKSVNVTFKVEKDEFKQLILQSTDGLKSAMEARGYSLSPIQVIDMTERFNLLELEEVTSQVQNKMHLDIKV